MKVEYNKEHMAKSVGRSMSISTKFAIEICDQIRNKKVSRAKTILQEAIELKKAIPLKKFNKDIAHKTKIGPGKFAPKACTEILSLVESAEANAQFKGLNTSNLVIIAAIANKAAKQWHYGRKRRRKMKRTHLDIIVAEGKDEKKKEEKTKAPTKKEVPTETKAVGSGEPKEQKKAQEKPIPSIEKEKMAPAKTETKSEAKKSQSKEKPKQEAKPSKEDKK